MGKRKRKKYNNLIIIGFLIFITFFLYTLFNMISEVIFLNQSKKNMEFYLSQKDVKFEEKYDYEGVLELPSINLKRGFLGIGNSYNNVKWNIELLRNDSDSIVLASHNGGLYNAYFKDLNKITLGDEIIIYDDYYKYVYIYSNSYDVLKDGYVDLFKVSEEKNIFLITCKGDNMQTVYVGTLISRDRR